MTFMRGLTAVSAMLVATLGVTACTQADRTPGPLFKYVVPSPLSATQKTLYERLGGQPAITAVVDQFVSNIVADDRINERFADTDLPKFKWHLMRQICRATGGPCEYIGRDMKTAHQGMNISHGEFYWTAEHLGLALEALEVAAKEKEELLALIGSLEDQIVGQ